MKSGIRTTEFWVTVLTIGAIVLTGVAGVDVLPGKYRAVAASLAAAGYAISRGLAKLKRPTA